MIKSKFSEKSYSNKKLLLSQCRTNWQNNFFFNFHIIHSGFDTHIFLRLSIFPRDFEPLFSYKFLSFFSLQSQFPLTKKWVTSSFKFRPCFSFWPRLIKKQFSFKLIWFDFDSNTFFIPIYGIDNIQISFSDLHLKSLQIKVNK